jgi:uncharacterized protein (DUF2147 family)
VKLPSAKFATIIFISLIFAIQSSTNLLTPSTEIDPYLIQINKEPLTEGVFTTMAIQLGTEGGFERVLSLLQQLVEDGKNQLHQITKTWRGVNARCSISKIKLAGRQEFFGAHVDNAKRNLAQRVRSNADHVAFRSAATKARALYKAQLNAAISRHSFIRKHFASKQAAYKKALAAVGAAQAAVKNWSPKGAALIQTTLKNILDVYAQISDVSVVSSPAEFIQASGSDAKVRVRMLQWFGQLKTHLLDARASFHLDKATSRNDAALEKNLAAIIKALGSAIGEISKAVAYNNQTMKSLSHELGLYGKLAHENEGLVKANNAYCANESTNYHSNEKRIRSEIKLFREILAYFRDHYSRVNDFIRAKYNK